MRAQWKRRSKGGPTPLLVIADDHGGHPCEGVQADDRPVRTVRAESLRDLAERTAQMGNLEAVRHVAQEIERLDGRIAGVSVRGIGTSTCSRPARLQRPAGRS